MRNVLVDSCKENEKHILYSTTFSENRAVYELMSKNMVGTEGTQMTSQYGA